MPHARVTPPPKPADIDLLLVDGDNLLHEARGRRDDGGTGWLLPELARWRPPGMRVVVALDGHPAPGEPSRGRAAHGVEHHYAGSRSADDLLIELLSAQPYARQSPQRGGDRRSRFVTTSEAGRRHLADGGLAPVTAVARAGLDRRRRGRERPHRQVEAHRTGCGCGRDDAR